MRRESYEGGRGRKVEGRERVKLENSTTIWGSIWRKECEVSMLNHEA